jgi:phenylalanyl-tRNA synthetase beta chain
MEFLANNTHVEYPQRVFEVGDCTVWDQAASNRATDIRKLACVASHSKANFTEMRSYLQPLMRNLGFEFTLSPIVDPSYLEGRVGSILIGNREVGLVGEVHPQVLENWKLEDPVAAMELDLDQLFRLQRH